MERRFRLNSSGMKNMSEQTDKTQIRKKKKKTAHQRMIEHHIKVAATIVAIVAVILTVFFVFFARYDFSKKAWKVMRDPFHGCSYTLYTKQQYQHSRVVIDKYNKKSGEVTIPDKIFGARVEELADNCIAQGVTKVTLGKHVKLVGEGFGGKTIVVPSSEERNRAGEGKSYIAFKDKQGSGFYYSLMDDDTLVAFAYFGTEEAYTVPTSFAGIKVSLATEYYVNDDYLVALAESEAVHFSTLPYNMVRVNEIQKSGIDPYIYSLTEQDSREDIKARLFDLPDQYQYLSDGSPANGETAIKLALIHNGDGKGLNCAGVMAQYDPIDFITSELYLTRETRYCHTEEEQDFGDWLRDGFVQVG